MKRNIINFMMLISLFALLFSCATTQRKTVHEQFYIPKFSWTPAARSTQKASDITMAIVSPTYSANSQTQTVLAQLSAGNIVPIFKAPLFSNFSSALGKSFQELLVSKGFTIKGPYSSFSYMTYPDKQGSDLAIYPTINLSVDISGVKNKNHEKLVLLSPNRIVYTQEGVITLNGQISLVVFEPLSGAKMWIKNIVLDPITIKCKSTKESDTPMNGKLNFADPGIINPIAQALESYYPKILNTAWTYIDPNEMESIKKKTLTIRGKKVY